MSFKYRFILSFVLLEAFFILLIVTVNFVAIKDSSDKLTREKIDSNITFLEERVKVPLSIYDLASLDNIVENAQTLGYINSIVIVDANNNIISDVYEFPHEKLDKVLEKKRNEIVVYNNETFSLRYQEVFEEETYLGAVYLIFDLSENINFIEQNRQNTIMIVLVEILISTLAAYIIGSRLTNMLTNLSEAAKTIGEDKKVDIPYQDKKDEIGLLSNSMNQMQEDLSLRNQKLKELAIVLNNQKNELIQANKSKDDFLANMSHELKTPLNSINIISSVMMKNKNGSLDEKQVENLQVINSCGNDLLYLINDVLDISKLEVGEIELFQEEFDFALMMQSIVAMIEPQAKAKQLAFEFSMDNTITNIYSDEQRIKQVIKNLLSNALKFVEKGAIRLTVNNHNEMIEVIVSDDGIGIAKEKLEHIFDRFKQADESTTRKYGGTGLGLAISKELIDLLKGTIRVESQEGMGTTFTIMIPKNLQKNLNVNTEMNLPQKTIDTIAVFYTDIVGFMSKVVEMKKEFTLNQSNNLESFKNILLEKNQIIIMEIDATTFESVKPLLSNNTSPIIFLSDDEVLDKELKFFTPHVYAKSISSSELIAKIKEL